MKRYEIESAVEEMVAAWTGYSPLPTEEERYQNDLDELIREFDSDYLDVAIDHLNKIYER